MFSWVLLVFIAYVTYLLTGVVQICDSHSDTAERTTLLFQVTFSRSAFT